MYKTDDRKSTAHIIIYRRCRCLHRKRLQFRRCLCRAGPDLEWSDSCRKHRLFCQRRLDQNPFGPGWTPMGSCPVEWPTNQ